jgi:hypothetical protein
MTTQTSKLTASFRNASQALRTPSIKEKVILYYANTKERGFFHATAGGFIGKHSGMCTYCGDQHSRSKATPKIPFPSDNSIKGTEENKKTYS